MEVLYLHGRGESPQDPPGDVVLSFPWKGTLNAPPLTSEWIAQPFPNQVAIVDEWLEDAAGAIGYSWGAWLLLCAVHERIQRGTPSPPLLLVSCVLGEGNYTGQGTWKAPRCEEILGALGIGPSTTTTHFDPADLRFVQGKRDRIGPEKGASLLVEVGHSVRMVDSGHLMHHSTARQALSEECKRLVHRMRTQAR